MMLDAANIWELIVRRAETTPGRELAVDQDGDRLRFGDYRERCERAAAGLAALGVGEGTVVSWQLPTWLESMVLMGALRRLGAVQNPILPIYRGREVGFVVGQARPHLLVVPSTWRGVDFEAMARSLTEGTRTEVLVCDRHGLRPGDPPSEAEPASTGKLPDGDPATLPPAPTDDLNHPDAPVRWLYYTSGTTAQPKGARHTDLAIRAAATGMAEALALRDDDRFALVFPFTHVAGAVYVYTALAYGLTFVVDEAFDPSTTIDLLRREDVTLAGAGTFFHQTYLKLQQDLPAGEQLFRRARAFPGGGAPKPPQLHYDVKAAFDGAPVVSGYGLTEAPIITMNDIADTDAALAETEGRPVRGASIRLVTLDGVEAAIGEEGEIRVKGPQVTKGYLDPALDADAFDAEGWFRTGDLGIIDDAGHVVITGRLKDVIIRKGENISAKEVEDLLFTHPKVADVAVIGLRDPERGERACAVVVTAGATDLTRPEMSEHLQATGLITRKLPEQLEIVDALPRNPAGKILKFELQQRFQD